MVLGLLQSRTYGFGKSRQDFTIGTTVIIPKGGISPVWLFVAIGALFLLWFFLYTRSRENKGKDVLLPLRLFRNKISNLGLGTQTIQWLILQGTFFTVSVYLQEVNHYNAIQTGLSRSVSNLGSSLGTALVGSALVAVKLPEGKPFAAALIVMLVITLIGLVLAVLIPRKPIEATEPASPGTAPAASQPTP